MKFSTEENLRLTDEGGKRIAVAVSGGADSMVMLALYVEAGADVVVVNVEHGIRGEESQNDSDFVRDICKRNGITFFGKSVDAPAYARQKGISVELAARELRYGIFESMIRDGVVDCVALAHHRDDQVETILMRIFRGTGIRGLRGIVDRPGFIHPMINYTRQEIREYALENGIPYREDSTNYESAYTRNYLRHAILPEVKNRFPQYEKAVVSLGKVAEELEDYLMLNRVRAVGHPDQHITTLPISVLDMHPAIAKKSFAEALREIGCEKDIESSHLTALLKLKDSENGARINLPFGYDAYRTNKNISIVKREEYGEFNAKFDINGSYAYSGFTYSFKETDEIVKGLTFDADKIPSDAVIRTRADGDRFRRYGGKEKSLSDYLTDLKMPRYMRHKVVVIASGHTVYAVLGVEISEQVKITEETKKIYKIEIGEEDNASR